MSRLSETRGTFAAKLRADDVLPEWRVHDYPPETIASPCAWVDVPSVRVDDLGRGTRQIVAQWSVILVVDGGDPSQVEALDEALPRIWDSIDGLEHTDVTAANVSAFDVGGPRTRGVVITADVAYYAKTFCSPLPQLAATPSP